MSEGKWIAPNVFRGVLYYSHGTSLANPMIASQHYLTAFGAVTMTFVSDTEMDFKVEGTLQTTDIARTKRLQRLRF